LCSFCPVHSWLSSHSLIFNLPFTSTRPNVRSLRLEKLPIHSHFLPSNPFRVKDNLRLHTLRLLFATNCSSSSTLKSVPSPVYHDPHIVFRRSNSGVRSSSQPLIPTKRLSARQHVTRQTNNHSSRPPLPVYQHQGLVQNHGLWRGPWQCLPHQKYRR
jgi:hypothetical protein